MPDDVSLNKLAIIERCLRRVAEEYRRDPARLENFTIQDSVVLNVQRACEAAIDMAMHVIAVRRLGVPQDARSAFDILAAERLIERPLAERMKAMVGFRNIAVHDYQQLQVTILQRVVEERLHDLKTLGTVLLQTRGQSGPIG
ncbi:MAG: DUF86 domain-containing protein [Planctomycetes bacterium]|nr:DUF86 domain-containing protein [Planctomycetota bacterium]MBM4058889.1 DUF86 domain-containing protein [Planctomycetota bacterium]